MTSNAADWLKVAAIQVAKNPGEFNAVASSVAQSTLGIACPAAAFIAARLSLGFKLQPSSDSAARTRCQVGD